MNTLHLKLSTFVFALAFCMVTKAQSLNSEFLYKIDIQLEPSFEIGQTPIGKRVIYPFKSGSFSGPRIKGTVIPMGADWVLRLDSATTKLDVRLLLETDDKQLIYCTYNGIVRNNPDGSTYWRITPVFETTSKKYEWLNFILAVGVGSFNEKGISYEVFAIK